MDKLQAHARRDKRRRDIAREQRQRAGSPRHAEPSCRVSELSAATLRSAACLRASWFRPYSARLGSSPVLAQFKAPIIRPALGFTPLPWAVLAILLFVVALYVVAAEWAKRIFLSIRFPELLSTVGAANGAKSTDATTLNTRVGKARLGKTSTIGGECLGPVGNMFWKEYER